MTKSADSFQEDSVQARIRSIRKALRWTQEALAVELGVSTHTIVRYERGDTKIPVEQAVRVASLGKVTLDWLLIGKGRAPAADTVRESQPDYVPMRPVVMLTKREYRERFDGIEMVENYAMAPLYSDEVSAGKGAFVEDNIESFAIVYASWVKGPGPHSAIRVRGESMSPVLPPGAIIGIDHAQRDRKRLRGKMVVVRLPDGELTVKYLKGGDRFALLEPANREHDTLIVEVEELDIVGKVSWYWGPIE